MKQDVALTNYATVVLKLTSLGVLLIGCGTSQLTSDSEVNAMQPFEVGQVWMYRTRPNEPDSRIVICRVENHDKLGQIIHIHVMGLQLKNSHVPAGHSKEIAHMPYSADALRKCITSVESTLSQLPEFEEGYKEWRAAFEQEEAGVWTLPVDEAVEVMEEAFSK